MALSDQPSAVLSPERSALGRPAPPAAPRRAENPQGARRNTVGDRCREASGDYTDSSGVFACRAATVASSVNPPHERPSVSAATSQGLSVRPRQHGEEALGGRDVWRGRERFGLPEGEPVAGPDGDHVALFTRDAGGPFRRRKPVVRRRRDRLRLVSVLAQYRVGRRRALPALEVLGCHWTGRSVNKARSGPRPPRASSRALRVLARRGVAGGTARPSASDRPES